MAQSLPKLLCRPRENLKNIFEGEKNDFGFIYISYFEFGL